MPAMRKSLSSGVSCVPWLQQRLDQLINFYQTDARVVRPGPSIESRPPPPLCGVVNARTLFSQERFNYETRRRACRRRNRISMVTWCRRNCCRSSRNQHRLSELRTVRPRGAQLPRATLAVSGDATLACREVATSAPLIYRRKSYSGRKDGRTNERTDGWTDWCRGIFDNWWGFAGIV